jgi:hypothetical protein
MAEAIIEANLTGDQRQQVCEWLNALTERLRPPEAAPTEQSGGADDAVETLENGANSGQVR